MKKYIIFCTVRDGVESKQFEFEYETDKELQLETLSADISVVAAALRSCARAAQASSDYAVHGLTFDRLRHFKVQLRS